MAPRRSRSLDGQVAEPDGARFHHPCVHPAQPQLAAEPRVDKAHRFSPEALDELRAAQMRDLADLQHSLAYREQAACREVIEAEIQVEIELVTGQRHPVGPARDQLRHPCVHHRHLPLRVSRAIGRARAAAGEPVVPVQPGELIECRLGRLISLAHRWAADDQDEQATIPRGSPDLVESGDQTLT